MENTKKYQMLVWNSPQAFKPESRSNQLRESAGQRHNTTENYFPFVWAIHTAASVASTIKTKHCHILK